MSGCIFCEIAAGRASAEVVHESADAIAFLDRFPAARGHVVVVPRVHAETLGDLPDEAVGGLFLAVKEAMRKVSSALRPAAMHVGWNHGRAAGQTVRHLHVHVLPRWHAAPGVQRLGEGAAQASPGDAEAIRRA